MQTENTASDRKVNTSPGDNLLPVKDIFNNMGRKAPFFLFGLLAIMGFLVFKDYLLFKKVYFFKGVASDSLNGTYPYLYNVADYIARYGIPKWSFKYGMGQNLFPFCLRGDPFDIFLYIAGKDSILYGMVYIELTKIIFSGLIFFYYLKQLILSDYTAIIGSLLYSFCGFMIVGSCWNIFSFEAFNMALLLLSFELLFTKQKWYLFPVAIFLLGISQPFNLYIYGMFLAIYSVFRLFQTNTFSLKNFVMIYIEMIGLGILGILLSAPFLLENISHLLASPRGSGVTSFGHILSTGPMFATLNKLQLGTCIMRFFSNDMLGDGNHYYLWWNYLEVPLFYCGLPCLLLMPQVFGLLEKRVKIIFILFILLWVLPVIFPFFRHAFWLFTGDYYRAYSFFIAFFFILYSLHALDSIINMHKINHIVLIATLIVLFTLLNYPFFPKQEELIIPDRPLIDSFIYRFVSVMLVVYAVVLYFIGKPRYFVYMKYFFLFLVVFELVCLAGNSVNNIWAVDVKELSQKKIFNDNSEEALKYLKSYDHSFYRIDKDYSSSPAHYGSLNDGMVQDYYGTSAYNPFNQLYYIFYMQLMGIANRKSESNSRWAIGLCNRPILESENSVKYFLTKSYTFLTRRIYFDSLATFGDVTLLQNRFALPIGYSYQAYIKENVFNNLSNDQKDMVSLKACVLKDEDISKTMGLKEFRLTDTIAVSVFNDAIYREYINDLKKDTLTVSIFREAFIKGEINVADDKMIYLSVPYDRGWTLKVDGALRKKIILNGGMTGALLTKGHHILEMSYELRYFKKGLILSIFGLFFYVGVFFFKIKT